MSHDPSNALEAQSLTSQDCGSRPSAKDSCVTRSDIWFDDGNLVLQAENTQFKVHKSILAIHSHVFTNMFALPQPENSATADGCHVVQVPDRATDWQNLLSLLYYNLERFRVMTTIPGTFLVSVIRLGEKYGFTAARDRCVECAKERFMTKLVDWDCLYGAPTARIPWNVDEEWYDAPAVFALIDLCEELGITTLLPVAYYVTVELQSLETIITGVQLFQLENVTLFKLSPSSQLTLLRGRENILEATHCHPFGWLTGRRVIPCSSCSNPTNCKEERSAMLEKYGPELRKSVSYALEEWNPTISCRLCAACIAAAKEDFEKGRRVIWDNLPTYFGLPSWSDLKGPQDVLSTT